MNMSAPTHALKLGAIAVLISTVLPVLLHLMGIASPVIANVA